MKQRQWGAGVLYSLTNQVQAYKFWLQSNLPIFWVGRSYSLNTILFVSKNACSPKISLSLSSSCFVKYMWVQEERASHAKMLEQLQARIQAMQSEVDRLKFVSSDKPALGVPPSAVAGVVSLFLNSNTCHSLHRVVSIILANCRISLLPSFCPG